ncbi:MAG: hypothetical protein V3S11_04895 [Elusimicrobiota bacterium]
MRKSVLAAVLSSFLAAPVLGAPAAGVIKGITSVAGKAVFTIKAPIAKEIVPLAVDTEALLRSLGLSNEDVEMMTHAAAFAERLEEIDGRLDEAYAAHLKSLDPKDQEKVAAIETERKPWAGLWAQTTSIADKHDPATRTGKVVRALLKHSLTSYVNDADLRLELIGIRVAELAEGVTKAEEHARTMLAALSSEDRSHMTLAVMADEDSYEKVERDLRARMEPKSPLHSQSKYGIHLKNAYDATAAWKQAGQRHTILAKRRTIVQEDRDLYKAQLK